MVRKFNIISVVSVALIIIWLWHEISNIPKALEPDGTVAVGMLIDNVRVISMVPGSPEVEEGRSVLILGDRIVKIGASGSIDVSQGVEVFDGQGQTLMPGLIDAHIHLSDEAELAGYLAHGVTGLRNMSGYPFHLQLAQDIKQGVIIGPDFITTGPILNSHGPNENIIQQIVMTDAEARLAVQAQYNAGYRILKVYSNLTREAFDAILDEANRFSMSIVGHSPEGVRTKGVPYKQPFSISWGASLTRGFTTLEHIETIVWHSLQGELDENRMRKAAAKLAASGETVTPTLIAHKRLVLIAETEGAYLDRPGSDTINPLVRFIGQSSAKYWSGVDATVYEKPHAEFFLMATQLLHEAGVSLIAGTDSGSFAIIPGASMARELELLVEAGLTPHEALASATQVSATVLGFEQTGVIAPGYRANLVLLPQDPLTQIKAVEFPSGVMVRGHWIDKSELETMRKASRETSFMRSAWRAVHMKLSL
jgi:hypothetical protein